MSEFTSSEQCKALKEQFYKELQELLKKHSVELYGDSEPDCVVVRQHFGDATSWDRIDFVSSAVIKFIE